MALIDIKVAEDPAARLGALVHCEPRLRQRLSGEAAAESRKGAPGDDAGPRAAGAARSEVLSPVAPLSLPAPIYEA
eukprot:12651806-Alexandrium_andersonii.AAC.1